MHFNFRIWDKCRSHSPFLAPSIPIIESSITIHSFELHCMLLAASGEIHFFLIAATDIFQYVDPGNFWWTNPSWGVDVATLTTCYLQIIRLAILYPRNYFYSKIWICLPAFQQFLLKFASEKSTPDSSE